MRMGVSIVNSTLLLKKTKEKNEEKNEGKEL
jgi:hypothetical protein